jgi:hypothetical protein
MLVVKAIVQDLPVEVLSRVLRIALEFLVAGWPLYAGELTVLQGVCRHWNDVLSADSAVWCRIYIDPWTPLHRVEKWLQWSKGPSLFVYINITVGWPAPSSTYSPSVFVDAVLNVVGRSFCRCVHLYTASKDADASTRFVPPVHGGSLFAYCTISTKGSSIWNF